MAAEAATGRCLGGVAVEGVSRSADRADDIETATTIERFAQAADMDIDGAQLDLGIAAPHAIEQLLAREDTAGPLEEKAQKAELGRAEMDRRVAARHAMRREIHGDIAEAQGLCRGA